MASIVSVVTCAVGARQQAALLPKHSHERLLTVVSFFISMFSTVNRAYKPFRDLYGATYELIDPDKGFRLLVEKVLPMVEDVFAKFDGIRHA